MALPPSTVVSVRSPPLEIDVPMNSVATGGGVEPHVIGPHVADEVLVDVAGDDTVLVSRRALIKSITFWRSTG